MRSQNIYDGDAAADCWIRSLKPIHLPKCQSETILARILNQEEFSFYNVHNIKILLNEGNDNCNILKFPLITDELGNASFMDKILTIFIKIFAEH